MRVTNKEVDNGVHPLHWATSPGPSPMGTDPLMASKWYIWFWNLCKSTSTATEQNVGQKPSRPPLLKITNWPSKRQRKPNNTEKQSILTLTTSEHYTTKRSLAHWLKPLVIKLQVESSIPTLAHLFYPCEILITKR
jgi:hypothetical protein